MRTASIALTVMLLSLLRLFGHFNEPRLTNAEIHAITGEPGGVLTSPPTPQTTLTIVSWNIERGVQYDRILAALRALSPDVILLQEVDRSCRRSGGRDVARDLARALDMHWIFGGEFQEIGEASDGQAAVTGQAILSRRPITDAAVVVFRDQSGWRWRLSPTQPRRGGRVALRAHTAGITFINVHLESQSDDGLRTRQLGQALGPAAIGTPTVVAGDFNFAPVPPAGFSDAFGGSLPQTSINHQHPIDWIFVQGLAVHTGRVERIADTSDHYPVVAIGSLAPSGQVAGFGASR